MKTIPLTQGYSAMVDDADYELVSRFKWYAYVFLRADGTKLVYAVRSGTGSGGKTGKMIRMHRFLAGYPRTDHKDGNGLNNQRLNLRPANIHQNNANRRKTLGRSSIYLGVSWSKKERVWVARIRHKYIGRFHEEFDAAQAYNLVALETFGEFAKLNTPQNRMAA